MDNDVVRQRLDEERARLQGLKDNFTEEGLGETDQGDSMSELSGVDQHQADIGTETFEREKDLSILERVEGELSDVDRALERLDDGTYGTCEACGRPIGEARLEAMPATRFCVEDQAMAEREARSAGESA